MPQLETQRATKRVPSPRAQPEPASSKRRRISTFVKRCIETSLVLASLAKEAAGDAGVPGLSVGLSVLAEVLERVEQTSANIEGIETLLTRIQGLIMILEEDKSSRAHGDVRPAYMQTMIESLSSDWESITQDLVETKKRHRVKRFFTAKTDANRIGDVVKKMDASIHDFLLGVGLLTIKKVEDVSVNVELTQKIIRSLWANLEQLRDEADSVRRTIEEVAAKQDDYVIPKGAKNAQYDSSNDRQPCLPGTRIEVLDKIRHWIIIAWMQKQLYGQILWINGLAGTGKTTIAYSIAQECDQKGLLGGNFFISRFSSDTRCRDPNFIFRTLSRQLCGVHTPFKRQVAEVLRTKPDIVNAGPSRQLEELIVKPLEQVNAGDHPFPVSVIVIDALDECSNEETASNEDNSTRSRRQSSTSIILGTLSNFMDRLAPLLFIITSRPEPPIMPLFEKSHEERKSLHNVTTPLSLHEVHLDSVLDDIRVYLMHEFFEVPTGYSMPEGWPSMQAINTLAELSGGLWIYAATAVRFVFDDDVADPERQLELLVHGSTTSKEPTTILNYLYNQVVRASYRQMSEPLTRRLRSILGTIALSQEALSISSLAALLGIQDHVVHNSLKGLHSVLHVPAEKDSAQAIRVIHQTFPEFLLSDSSDKHDAFRVASIEQHQQLFTCCLATLNAGLRYDIIGLTDPSSFKTEAADFPGRVERCIPNSLSYAARYWGTHLASSGLSSGSITLFQSFLNQHLLHWLEICSLLDAFHVTITSLDAARYACQCTDIDTVDVSPLLIDARRFALTYATCINTAPLEVYHSALALAPTGSIISQTYSQQRRNSFSVCRGAQREWGPCLDVFSIHDDMCVKCVAFSPDNNFFVTGGSDRLLRIWQASTRVLVLGIQIHEDEVAAVAYSQDGLYIASGGRETLCIWHAASGAHIHTLAAGSLLRLRYIAFTPDGTYLLSVGEHNRVKLWRISDGALVCGLEGPGFLHQAGISPDGEVIAHIDDAFLLLYDVASGESENLILPDTGRAATFSLDGLCVAAAAKQAILIWSYPAKSLLRSIEVPDEITTELAFSKDGSYICCGCSNGTVYIWPVTTNSPPRQLGKGYPFQWQVMAVAWSPDGSQIISSSADGTIRLWDVTEHVPIGEQHDTPGRDSSGPSHVLVALSKDGVTITDLPPLVDITSIRLPLDSGESATGDTPVFTLHPNRPMAWDHAIRLGSAPIDMWPRSRSYLWASLTGQPCFSNWVPTVISKDGTLMVYPLGWGRSAAIRSLVTGEVMTTLTPDRGHFWLMTFSPDAMQLATASTRPAMVEVWDVKAGARITSHYGHEDDITCLTYSPDGRFVVSGSKDTTVCVFEVATKHIVNLLDHESPIQEIVLTADGALLVALDLQETLHVWDMETGAHIHAFLPFDQLWALSLPLSPVGLLVPTDDGDRTVMLWTPGDRRWPMYHISEDGWVYAKGPGYTHRLGWLPPEWRHPVCSEGAILCVCEEGQMGFAGKVIGLDMSQLLDRASISYAG